MKVILELPDEFKQHFEMDKFEDSLCRVLTDISERDKNDNYAGISGNYEEELIEVLVGAFKKSNIIPEKDGWDVVLEIYQDLQREQQNIIKYEDPKNPDWEIVFAQIKATQNNIKSKLEKAGIDVSSFKSFQNSPHLPVEYSKHIAKEAKDFTIDKNVRRHKMNAFNEEFLEKIFRDNSEWFENIDIEKQEIGEGYNVYVTLSGICVHFSCSEDTFLDEVNKMINGLKTEIKFSDSEDASFGQKHALECFENIKKSMPDNKYKIPERDAVKDSQNLTATSENKNIKNPQK